MNDTPHTNTADDAQAQIDWVPGVRPSPELAACRWGGPRSLRSLPLARRESGLLVESWRGAAEVLGRRVDLELLYELDALVAIALVGVSDEELSRLGFTAVQAEDGMVVKALGVTLWIADLYDRQLRLEPDPERTDAGMV